MRLHHLEIQAFGPFPDKVEVDFDQLAESGLFLLTGATGAGKTSVLDALCFALYGDVPGARGVAKRLRCDNAPADRAPQVRLEWSIAGRRLRLTRSPAWQRPKRRGSGLTTEQARVVCEERRNGVWEALSTRLDETGHLVQGLLGMTMSQFCQVALLPQGEFQGFLRARTDERHQLLQQLFATGRFEQIERWVREKARVAHRHADASTREVLATAGLLEETALGTPGATPSPATDPALTSRELAEIDASGGFAEWISELSEVLRAHDDLARVALDRATTRQREAQAELEAVRRIHHLLSRARVARRELDELAAARPARAERRARLSAAREAATLMPLHHLLVQHTVDTEQAGQQLQTRIVQLRALGEELGAPWWTAIPDLHDALADADNDAFQRLHEACDVAVAQARVLPQLAARREALTGELHQLVASLREAEERGEQHRRQLESLPAKIQQQTDLLDSLREASRDHELLDERLRSCAGDLDRIDRLSQQEAVLDDAHTRVSAARERMLESRGHWLDLRESRINGMAAELASGLASGGACPVCGSDEHPSPARLGAESVSAADEKAARDLLTDREFALTSAVEEERTVRDEVSGLRALIAGRTREQLAAAHASTAEELTVARRALDALAPAGQELEKTRATLARHTDAVVEADRAVAAQTSRQEALADELARVDAEIVSLIEPYAVDDPDQLSRALADVQKRLAETAEARSAFAAATRTRIITGDEFDGRLRTSSFASRAALVSAHLESAEMDELAASITTDERREAVARAVLDEAEVRAALMAPAVDLDAVESAANRTENELAAAQRLAAHAERSRIRAEQLTTRLRESLDCWRPRHDTARATADLAALVEGKSADNVQRMRLSTYVLAWRLSQVVAAANERLARMTGGRYSLVHSDRRANRETRGGLSIEIRDDWSGEEREPATLSGGETFVVSLALALGLSDVVAAESGGVSLDTLFIDEGFGSLDAETLDDVLDVLDSLREGGRVIGVVSHVAEMRSRIPAQLQVLKDQAGSRLRVNATPARGLGPELRRQPLP